jgi:hypothetical protein
MTLGYGHPASHTVVVGCGRRKRCTRCTLRLPAASVGICKAHEGCARGAGCERSYARVQTLTTTGVWRRAPEGNDHTLSHRECKPYTRRSGAQPIRWRNEEQQGARLKSIRPHHRKWSMLILREPIGWHTSQGADDHVECEPCLHLNTLLPCRTRPKASLWHFKSLGMCCRARSSDSFGVSTVVSVPRSSCVIEQTCVRCSL